MEGTKKGILTSWWQDVLDKDKYGLLGTELYPLPDYIYELPNSQISRNQISAFIGQKNKFTFYIVNTT